MMGGLAAAGFLSELGFSGFVRRASSSGKRSFAIVLAGFEVMAKSAGRARSEIPQILKILILTKAGGRPAARPLGSDFSGTTKRENTPVS